MIGSSVSVDGISVTLPVQPAIGLAVRNTGSTIVSSIQIYLVALPELLVTLLMSWALNSAQDCKGCTDLHVQSKNIYS